MKVHFSCNILKFLDHLMIIVLDYVMLIEQMMLLVNVIVKLALMMMVVMHLVYNAITLVINVHRNYFNKISEPFDSPIKGAKGNQESLIYCSNL